MNGTYKFRLYDAKTKDELKIRTDKIIKELELYGRSIDNCSQVNKTLSRRFGEAVKDEVIVFAWNRYTKKSIIVLHPSFRLVRFGDKHVSLFRKENQENKHQ